MKCLVWNVRGFNHPLKQKEVVARIKKLNINFACILVTRLNNIKCKILSKEGFHIGIFSIITLMHIMVEYGYCGMIL